MSSIVGGRAAGKNLTMEGGAELFWALFVEPLQ